MKQQQKEDLVRYLAQFVTEGRFETIKQVLSRRTRYLTVVLEDIYQPHNASAVLRSCDCFGIQDVHIIENDNQFNPNQGVTIGADQWITMHKYSDHGQNNTQKCYQRLHEKGYRILATTPHRNDTSVRQVSVDQKTALVFGAEKEGVSDFALNHADGHAKIPMEGFSESFNVSVGAALCLYELSTKLRQENEAWKLEEYQKTDLKIEWLKNSIRASEQIIDRYLVEKNK